MKKYIYLIIFGFSIANSFSQNVADGLRLGLSGNNGTARFQAMGGAFGSLGGDFSAININPAGSAIFSNNQWSVSINNNLLKNSTNYFGNKTSDNNNSIGLNQIAGVFVFENFDTNNEWNKFSLGINYENISNFDNDVFSAGTNENSLANYFSSYANNSKVSLQDLENLNYDQFGFAGQQAWLGFQGFIINPNTASLSNKSYNSNIREGGKYKQQNNFSSRGQNGKINFNASAQYQKWLSIGVNLNSHFTDYKESTTFIETNNNPNVALARVAAIQFNNDIHTFGSGFSLQLGFIAKLNDLVRIGASYESPTWYELNDEVTQSLQSTLSGTSAADDTFNDVDPVVVTVFEPYQLQTPSKLTGSASLIFAKKGLVSLDLTRTDYSNTSFGPDVDFGPVNANFSSLLKSTISYKLGTEYRIKQWSLRGGYRLDQSPYKNKKVMGDLYGISTGFGYNWGETKLDVSYAYSKRNLQNQFFKQGLTDFSTTTAINNNVTFTLVFEL